MRGAAVALSSGNRLGSRELMDKQRQRQTAGLPSVFLSASEIRREFGFAVEAALYSEGAAEANPVALARGLMAQWRAAQALFPRVGCRL